MTRLEDFRDLATQAFQVGTLPALQEAARGFDRIVHAVGENDAAVVLAQVDAALLLFRAWSVSDASLEAAVTLLFSQPADRRPPCDSSM